MDPHDDRQAWTDRTSCSSPNVALCTWVTSLLMEAAVDHRRLVPDPLWSALTDAQRGLLPHDFRVCVGTGETRLRCGARLNGCVDPVLALGLFNAWAVALRSPNMSLKAVAARAAAGILSEAVEDVRVVAAARQLVRDGVKEAGGVESKHGDDVDTVLSTLRCMERQRRLRLTGYLDAVSLDRLQHLCLIRMSAETCRGSVRVLWGGKGGVTLLLASRTVCVRALSCGVCFHSWASGLVLWGCCRSAPCLCKR